MLAPARYITAISYMHVNDALFSSMFRHVETAYIHLPHRMHEADVHDEVEAYGKNAQLNGCVHAATIINLAHFLLVGEHFRRCWRVSSLLGMYF